MSDQQSYPPYGKPQSNWQPYQDDETASIPNAYASSTSQGGAAPYGAGAYYAGNTAEIPPTYNTAGNTNQMPPVNQQPYYGTYATQPGQTVNSYATYAVPKKSSGGAKTFFISFAGAALACVLVAGMGLGTGLLRIGGTTTAPNPSGTSLGATTSTTIEASEDESRAEVVAAKALPSVAYVGVYTQSATPSSLYGNGSGSNATLTQSSLGSGVVLTQDGYIITNYHVVEGSSALRVTVEGVEYEADIVGVDETSDLAVIKARDASDMTPIELGDSDNLTVGEWVMTIGSPFGLEQSVATGVVSATSRSQVYNESNSGHGGSGYTLYVNLIQTDAAINPGNSGGALVNKNGQLIGINTLITSYSGNYSGVGFAIPVNYAINIAQQIINGQTPTHAQLGVTLSTVTPSNANRYGLSVDSGAYVSSVARGSGADAAGLKQGDIITKFDSTKITSASDLMLAVRGKNAGDTVVLEVNRDGNVFTVDVVLGSDGESASTSQNAGNGSPSIFGYFGGNNSGKQGSNS